MSVLLGRDDRDPGADIFVLSMWPFKWPFCVGFLGFFALPLPWAAIAARVGFSFALMRASDGEWAQSGGDDRYSTEDSASS